MSTEPRTALEIYELLKTQGTKQLDLPSWFGKEATNLISLILESRGVQVDWENSEDAIPALYLELMLSTLLIGFAIGAGAEKKGWDTEFKEMQDEFKGGDW